MPSRKVLIVDDSQAMRRSIVYALQRVETTCLEAQDGADGLKRLAAERFDIILTDINMPIMDGLKLIAHVRAEESAHKATPIVVITTESAPEDRRRALALGANAYLVKPLRANAVLEAVKALLNPLRRAPPMGDERARRKSASSSWPPRWSPPRTSPAGTRCRQSGREPRRPPPRERARRRAPRAALPGREQRGALHHLGQAGGGRDPAGGAGAHPGAARRADGRAAAGLPGGDQHLDPGLRRGRRGAAGAGAPGRGGGAGAAHRRRPLGNPRRHQALTTAATSTPSPSSRTRRPEPRWSRSPAPRSATASRCASSRRPGPPGPGRHAGEAGARGGDAAGRRTSSRRTSPGSATSRACCTGAGLCLRQTIDRPRRRPCCCPSAAASSLAGCAPGPGPRHQGEHDAGSGDRLDPARRAGGRRPAGPALRARPRAWCSRGCARPSGCRWWWGPRSGQSWCWPPRCAPSPSPGPSWTC